MWKLYTLGTELIKLNELGKERGRGLLGAERRSLALSSGPGSLVCWDSHKVSSFGHTSSAPAATKVIGLADFSPSEFRLAKPLVN